MLTLVVSLLLFLCAVYLFWFNTKRSSKGSEPPMVPYYIPWLGRGLDYQKDPCGFLQKCEKKYGPIFTVAMGGRYFTFVTDPFTHPIIAKESRRLNFRIHSIPFVKKVFDFVRRGVEHSTNNGLFHQHLQGESLEELMKIMMDNLYKVLNKDRFTSPKWCQANLLALTYDVMFTAGFKSLFGQGTKSSSGFIDDAKFQEIIKDFVIFDDAFPLIAQGYPISSLKGVSEARERLWELVRPDVMEKREGVHPLISESVENVRREGRSSDDAMKQSLAQLFAAESNTVITAFWALYYLLTCPEAAQAARQEISRMLKETSQEVGSQNQIHFDRSQLAKMTVLESILRESLRLSDSPSMLRRAMENFDLNVKSLNQTFRIREGDTVMAVLQLTHQDPEIFPEPEKFKFDRFLNEDGSEKTDFYKNGKQVRYYLQPFGSGLSKCPGRFFAVAEIKQFLILMLLYYDIEPVEPLQPIKGRVSRTAFGSLPPTNDVPVRFRRREMVPC